MKKALVIFSTILFLFLISSCQKEIPTKLTGYFYTSTPTMAEDYIVLFIDGERIGKLPFINISKEMPLSVGDTTLTTNALKYSLMSGKHIFRAEKSDGKVISLSEVSFLFYKNKTESSTKGNVGGNAINLTNEIFSMNLFE
ncbi:MAG: hypothetical protein V4561_09415 [Bacteroidota bacterium]